MTDPMESNSSTEAALAILSARRRRTEMRGIVYRNLRWHPDIQPIVDAIERGEAFEAATGETYTTVWKGMSGWASGVTLDDLKFVLEALRQRRARLSEREQQLAEEILNGTPSPPTFDETEDFDRAEPDTDTAEPWEQPLSTHPISFGAIRSHNGRTWRSRHPFNVWEPGAPGIDSRIWEEVVESEEPEEPTGWVDTNATVTSQSGQLYYVSAPIATLGLTAGQAIRLGDAETTYVSTWGGTDNLMQINPYVAASTGAKVWKWA